MGDIRRITSSGQFLIGRGVLETVILKAGDADNATLQIYDGTSVDDPIKIDIASLANDSKPAPSLDIPYKTGLYGALTGAGATAGVIIR